MSPDPSLADESSLLNKLKAHLLDRFLRRWNAQLQSRTGPMLACFPRDWVGRAIVVNGLYERELLAALRHLLFTRWPREGAVALDVGANIGNHTLSFAPHFESVVAVEPNPVALHLLQANLLFNGVANVQVVPCGLGDAEATLAFSVPAGNLGGAGFRPGGEGALQLQVRRGDDVVRQQLRPGQRLRFVKIDVEGFEPQVVRGLAATLAEHRPVVAFESHGGQGRDTQRELAALGCRHLCVTERSSALPPALRSTALRAVERLAVPRPLCLKPIAEVGNGFEPLILASFEPLA